jgi:hypothetical protein
MYGMTGPEIRAVMKRRLLVSYRIEPDVLQAALPAPFRPALASGYGVGSICLIWLAGIRPATSRRTGSGTRAMSAAFGLRAQNVAHRIAVVLDKRDGPVHAVYIPHRYTSSRLAVVTGSALFPRLRLARFHTDEQDGRYRITAASADGTMRIEVDARKSTSQPTGSVFADLAEAARFFRLAPVGYSATPVPGVFEGVTLDTSYREMYPLLTNVVRSSFFDDPRLFPPGTATVDSAFAASGLATWRRLDEARAAST